MMNSTEIPTAAGAMDMATDSDGLPTDPRLRRVAVSMLMRLRGNRAVERNWIVERGADAITPRRTRVALLKSHPSAPGWDRLWAERKPALDIAGSVIDCLLKSGRVENPGRFLEYRPPVGRGPDTPEGKRANFAAAVDRIASNVAVSPEARSRAALLYRAIDAIGFYHRIPFADGRAVFTPTAFSISAEGLVVTAGIVVSATKKGIRCHSAPAAAIASEWAEDCSLTISVDPSKCRREIVHERKMAKLRLLPRSRDYGSEFPHTLDTLRLGLRKSILSQREGVEAFLGEVMTVSGWAALNSSLARRPRKPGLFRGLLFSILDERTRAACLRDPHGTVELYNWFCPRSTECRTRRLQASESYPILTSRLRELGQVIDAADELAPAIASHLDIPRSAVRHLVGLNWQRFGTHLDIRRVENLTDGLRLIAMLVPEDRPVKRSQWLEALHLGRTFLRELPYPPSPNVTHGMRRLSAVRKFSEVRALDAVRDLARTVLRTSENSWGAEAAEARIEDAILRTVMGEQGSAKRLVAFSENWHRGVARRNATIRGMERKASSTTDDMLTWEPLTAEPFVCKAGRMDWLMNEDELAAEGQAMRHCVGGHWYVTECYRGNSHIATVTDAKGNRSTAEFTLDGVRVLCNQNQAPRNHRPSAGCAQVVASFLKDANGKKAKPIIDLKAVRQAAKQRLKVRPAGNGYDDHNVRYEPMTEDEARDLLRLYDDCLPPRARLSPDQWRELVEEEIAAGRRCRKSELGELEAY